MLVYANGAYTPEYLAQQERIDQLKAERGETKPFVVGQFYETMGGEVVQCVQLSRECAQFSDWWWQDGTTGGWRYNRDGIDRGRCTGTAFDHSDPRCVIPESVK